eukprot:TRINITY_DN33831_c0_g1_i1.p1 TRINITY_DN33831_c0_g1~~TRINITY_DN33831_c0_g1_i1.p1  ORF type:complete len:583 (-),score=70.90 TRINITY_DN33831_c0_g1_i1:300-2048(-)
MASFSNDEFDIDFAAGAGSESRGIPMGASSSLAGLHDDQFVDFSTEVMRSLPTVQPTIQPPTVAESNIFARADRSAADMFLAPSTFPAGLSDSLKPFQSVDAVPMSMGDAAFPSGSSTFRTSELFLASSPSASPSSVLSSPHFPSSRLAEAAPDSGRAFEFVLDAACPTPPQLPGKPYFVFPTHFRASSSPVSAMNAILNAFHAAPWAIDPSIKAHKFKIKSFSFVEGHQVVFAVRMYTLPKSDDLLVELQRCSGCKVAFRKVFSFLEASLAEEGMVVRTDCEESPASPCTSSPRVVSRSFSFAPPAVPDFLLKELDETVPLSSEADASALEPLKAMLESEDVSCQREAAACMASLSSDCTDQAATHEVAARPSSLSPSLFVETGTLETLASTTVSASDSQVKLACAASISNVLAALAARNAIVTLSTESMRATSAALASVLSMATDFESARSKSHMSKAGGNLSAFIPNTFPETVEGSMSRSSGLAPASGSGSGSGSTFVSASAFKNRAVVDLNRSEVARSLQLSRECARGIHSLAVGSPSRSVSHELLTTCRAALLSASAIPDRKLQAHVRAALQSLVTA